MTNIPWMKTVKARDVNEIIPTSLTYSWDPFNRDFVQIVHSDFFKRLSGKTQVHSFPRNDHLRTRLTHSVEVAQIGRQISRYFSKKMFDFGMFSAENSYFLNFSKNLEELTAASCMLHDTGHPPFGHTGAHVLNSLGKRFSEEFDDNKQVFRLCLNKMWNEKFDPSAPLIAAVMKKSDPSKVAYLSEQAQLKNVLGSLGIEGVRHPASFFMEAADDIAYITADLSDYLRYFVTYSDFQKLLSHVDITPLNSISILDHDFNETKNTNLYGALMAIFNSNGEKSDEAVVEFSSNLIKCLLKQAFSNIDSFFSTLNDFNLEALPSQLNMFIDNNMYKDDQNLLYLSKTTSGAIFSRLKKGGYKDFILDQPYIGLQNINAKRIITELFLEFESLIHHDYRSADVFKMVPYDFKGYLISAHNGEAACSPARVILDFMSGMTDQYAYEMWDVIVNPMGRRKSA